MTFIISANHVKVFAKAIHCLARLGNDVFLDFSDTDLEVKTVNASRSAFACFTFSSAFFEKYDTSANGDNKLPGCKIPVRTFLQVFRSIAFVERSVEACEFGLGQNCCELIFTLNCKHAVIKTYRLNFHESECLNAVFTKEMCPNKLTAPCKLLQDVLVNFPSSLDEISMAVSPCKVLLSSCTDRTEGSSVKTMSTLMHLNPDEFLYYQIGVDTSISFCLKDLRAILGFVEGCNGQCQMDFEYGGKPIVLGVTEEGVFSANFVLATLSGGDDELLSVNLEQSTSNTVGHQKKSSQDWKKRNQETNAADSSQSIISPACVTEEPYADGCSAEIPDQSHYHLVDATNLAVQSHSNVRDLFFCAAGNSITETRKGILVADSDDEG